jgi:solute carrier family 25 phosphate transporter 23/24/25/41
MVTFKFLLAGAIAGIVSRTVVSPLEVIATVNMASAGDVGNPLEELAALWERERLVGFFKGNGVNCIKVAPTKGIQFVAFEAVKAVLISMRSRALSADAARARRRGDTARALALEAEARAPKLNVLDRLFAGGCAGMVAAAIVYPLEVVKTLLTVDRAKYKGILQGFALLIRETNSWFSLYRGLTPTLVAMFPYVGIEFAVYETLKIAIEARRAKAAGADAKAEDANLPTVALLLIGALAGALAQSSCHPLDVVRKRLQLQGLGGRPKLYHNMIHGIFGIARAEGVKGLYKGLGPAWIATIPGTGSSYVVYEIAKAVFGITSR